MFIRRQTRQRANLDSDQMPSFPLGRGLSIGFQPRSMPIDFVRRISGRVALLMLLSTAAHGAITTVINNGLAPPNPANIYVNAPVPSGFDMLVVRNLGCPPGWPGVGGPSDPCPSPGASTGAEIAAGAYLGFPSVQDSSNLLISGGDIVGLAIASGDSTLTVTGSTGYFAGFQGAVLAHDNSNVIISGGELNLTTPGGVIADGTSNVSITGGAVGGVQANESSRITVSGGSISQFQAGSEITVIGTGFQVDGSPVPFGPLAASSGTLTGTLSSGEPLDAPFTISGGTIILVFPPGLPALRGVSIALLVIGLALVGCVLCRPLLSRTTA